MGGLTAWRKAGGGDDGTIEEVIFSGLTWRRIYAGIKRPRTRVAGLLKGMSYSLPDRWDARLEPVPKAL